MRQIAESGAKGFYEGAVAQSIVDSEYSQYLAKLIVGLQSRGGKMGLEDLAGYEADIVDPISYTYGKEAHTVWECPPNGYVIREEGLSSRSAKGSQR